MTQLTSLYLNMINTVDSLALDPTGSPEFTPRCGDHSHIPRHLLPQASHGARQPRSAGDRGEVQPSTSEGQQWAGSCPSPHPSEAQL